MYRQTLGRSIIGNMCSYDISVIKTANKTTATVVKYNKMYFQTKNFHSYIYKKKLIVHYMYSYT